MTSVIEGSSLYSSSVYEVSFNTDSGLFRDTKRSMPRESSSVWVTVPRFVGINVATKTFRVNMTANMAKVKVERDL